MHFIDKSIVKLLRFLANFFLISSIIIMVGYPIYCMILSKQFNIIVCLAIIISNIVLGILFGTISELALDKLERDSKK